MKTTPYIYILAIIILVLFLEGCSSTSNLPEGEQLYIGIKKVEYLDTFYVAEREQAPDEKRKKGYDYDAYVTGVEEEVAAALDYAPNGAFLGSSYMRTPFPIRLWIYNAYANSTSGFGKWMRNSFGSEPVLLSYVAPATRALVAQNILTSYGMFDAKVESEIITQKNPLKAKVGYKITTGRLSVIDTLKYVGFGVIEDSLIRGNMRQSLIRPGTPFSATSLEEERDRISDLFRNNGFYYYRSAYSSYLADTISNPGIVEVRLQPVDGIPEEATKQWYLGNLRMELRRNSREQLTDSVCFRDLSIFFSGDKPPIRPSAILRDLKLRPMQMFSQERLDESSSTLNSLGLFSSSTFSFSKRDTTATQDTLDMTLSCVLDKPYDGTIEANYSLKSNDQTGPGLVFSLTKKNAFRGGEKLSISLNGSYEWQTGNSVSGSTGSVNSYEYGGEISIEYPRLETPFHWFRRHRFYSPPSTLFSISADMLNRADYFKMLSISAAVTYKFQTSKNVSHELSPLILDFNSLQSTTSKFDAIVADNPAIYYSMSDMFIPKIQYSVSYTSPSSYRSPIAWEATITEAGNIISLIYTATGKGFNEKDKSLLGNPYSQFLKLTTSFRKTWQMGFKSQLVARIATGIIWTYGNSDYSPYTESLYVGGANSIRAFTVRSIGPGRYIPTDSKYSYFDQVGDFKLEANLEYRFNIMGSLYGALFLDAGNVWLLKKDEGYEGGEFKLSDFPDQLATGTGFGIRYDLDFFVVRFDIGIGLHVPYDTGKSGYYNIPKFKDGLGYHFAIGYPF